MSFPSHHVGLHGVLKYLCMCFLKYLLLRLVVSVCSSVRPCVRVKNGNGSRMRALPDVPSTCDQFTVTGQSTTFM